MFIATSLRRAPSTLSCDSITWRRRPVSSSVRPFTRVSGLTPVMPRIFFAVEWPIPKIYVSAISMRFSFGRSTPAIRAKPFLLALALLVTRVLADDPHDAFAPYHLAVLADSRDRGFHLHDGSLLVSVDDAPAIQIVGRQLHRDLVPGQDLDEVHPHLARDVRQDPVTVFQLHAEHRVRKGLHHRALDLDAFFFGHPLVGLDPGEDVRPLEEPGRGRAHLPHREGARRVAEEAVLLHADVQRDDVALAEEALAARDPVHHFLVDRGADARGESPIPLERRLAARIADEFLRQTVQLQRADPGSHLPRQHEEALPHDPGAGPDQFDFIQIVDLDHRALRRDGAHDFPIARWIASKTSSTGPDASTLRRTDSSS